jgi:hypothetical protein
VDGGKRKVVAFSPRKGGGPEVQVEVEGEAEGVKVEDAKTEVEGVKTEVVQAEVKVEDVTRGEDEVKVDTAPLGKAL